MEPIGFITMYYPFVDGETRGILESLMEKSEDFQDFITRLGKRVCSEDVPLSLVFIAAVWSMRGEVKEIQEMLAKKYEGNLMIIPWTFSPFNPTDRKALEAKMVGLLDDAIASEPDDWILLHLLLRRTTVLVATPEGIQSFDDAKNLVDENSELECFRPEIRHGEARIKDYEGDMKSTIEIYYEVLGNARKQGNEYLTATTLLDLGDKISLTDSKKALQFIEEAYRISKGLGMPTMERSALQRMKSIAQKFGEYDLALKCLFDVLESPYAPSHVVAHLPLDISSLYSDLGEGKEALSWVMNYEEKEIDEGPAGLSGHGCPYLYRARALLLLNRTDEALENIEILKEIAFRTGWELWLAGHYYVSGLYEIAMGQMATGMTTIQSALETYERLNIQSGVNRSLIALTRAEIMSYDAEKSNLDPRDSGPWMIRLEKESTDMNLTGILMQHAMLKAEFQTKLGQIDAARETLETALEISNQPSVKTLRKQILAKIDELEKTTIA